MVYAAVLVVGSSAAVLLIKLPVGVLSLGEQKEKPTILPPPGSPKPSPPTTTGQGGCRVIVKVYSP